MSYKEPLRPPGRRTEYVRLGRDLVAKRFLTCERTTLIQDQAPTRNYDSDIHSPGFDCARFSCTASQWAPAHLSRLSTKWHFLLSAVIAAARVCRGGLRFLCG